MREGNMAMSDREAANEFGRGPDGRKRKAVQDRMHLGSP